MSILLLESLHAQAEELLAAQDELIRAADPNAPDGDLASVQAILTRGRGKIGEPLFERCPKLRVIARAGAGLDNLDTAAAKRRGIPVIFAPGANTDTVAEHTLALILDLVRGISRCAAQVAAGQWEARGKYAGNEVRGLVLGIVGFGSIGKRVAELGSAFGMRVVVAAHKGRAGGLPLAELLAQADVVSLHLPLTAETRGLIGARELGLMRPGAYLVNTARGALVDHAALREALATGRLAGFAADVLDVEPPAANEALLRSERVLLTPHVASLTAATYRTLCVETAKNVVALLRGTPPAPRSVFAG